VTIAVIGAAIITVTRPRDFGSWRTWALLLPLGSAVLRGVIPPIVKLGLETWPSPLWACLIGYITSSLVVLTVQRVRKGGFVVEAPWSGRLWFAVTGIFNGMSALTLFAAVRHGPITLVAPLVAIYPLVTVLLSAIMLHHVRITARIVAGTTLAVAGVALVLIG
jgi:drug/metabolite transporter (DMT)-like permease